MRGVLGNQESEGVSTRSEGGRRWGQGVAWVTHWRQKQADLMGHRNLWPSEERDKSQEEGREADNPEKCLDTANLLSEASESPTPSPAKCMRMHFSLKVSALGVWHLIAGAQ